jgi:hypothetical protein
VVSLVYISILYFSGCMALDGSAKLNVHAVATTTFLAAELHFSRYQRHLCKMRSKAKLSVYATRDGICRTRGWPMTQLSMIRCPVDLATFFYLGRKAQAVGGSCIFEAKVTS